MADVELKDELTFDAHEKKGALVVFPMEKQIRAKLVIRLHCGHRCERAAGGRECHCEEVKCAVLLPHNVVLR